jgi:hypothetical protein
MRTLLMSRYLRRIRSLTFNSQLGEEVDQRDRGPMRGSTGPGLLRAIEDS